MFHSALVSSAGGDGAGVGKSLLWAALTLGGLGGSVFRFNAAELVLGLASRPLRPFGTGPRALLVVLQVSLARGGCVGTMAASALALGVCGLVRFGVGALRRGDVEEVVFCCLFLSTFLAALVCLVGVADVDLIFGRAYDAFLALPSVFKSISDSDDDSAPPAKSSEESECCSSSPILRYCDSESEL